MNLSALKNLPDGVELGTELTAGLDGCLLLGFARLGPTQHEALANFASVFISTPLAKPVQEALASLKRSEFLTKHFCALAAARSAILGSHYDALLAQARTALGRPVPSAESTPTLMASPEGQHTALFSSTQQCLAELALAGFKNLSAEPLTGFAATLEQIQADPKLARLAALLTGFLGELLGVTPSSSTDLPIFRWSDLWARSMIAAQQTSPLDPPATVTGKFFPLGVDIRSHPHFANVVFHGWFECKGSRRFVRIPLSSYKVDVIANHEIWHLFRPGVDPLLESLNTQTALEFSNVQLLPTGDLLWPGKATKSAAFNPFSPPDDSANIAPLPPEAPLSRHPVQLAEPVILQACTIKVGPEGARPALTVGADTLPLFMERVPSNSELDSKTLSAASALIGLLRFDRGEWGIQPLAVRTKSGKKEMIVAISSKALDICKKDKTKTLATLSERAGKLLRE